MARHIPASRVSILALSVLALAGTLHAAAESAAGPPLPPAPPALPVPAPRAHRARAVQYGAFVGGTASQYDLCASKGHLPKGQSPKRHAPKIAPAEPIARKILGELKQPNGGADFSSFAFEGWDMAKRDLALHAAEYTREKCASVAAAWAALLANVPLT